MDAIHKDQESIIGEECHIVARKPKGPRGTAALPLDKRDEIDNLILLCRIHHKQIDDQVNTYTAETLTTIKAKHERWVQQSLAKPKTSSPVFFAFRIDKGIQLCNTVIGSHASSFNNDQPRTQDEALLIGEFVQDIKDYSDLWGVMVGQDQLMAQFKLNEQLEELKNSGYLVYAIGQQQKLYSTAIKESFEMSIGYIFVLHKDNPLVRRKDEEIEKIMQINEQSNSPFTNFIPVMRESSSIQFI